MYNQLCSLNTERWASTHKKKHGEVALKRRSTTRFFRINPTKYKIHCTQETKMMQIDKFEN